MGTIKVMAFEPNRPSTVLCLPMNSEDIEDYLGGRLGALNLTFNLALLCCEDRTKRVPNRDIAIVDQLGKHFVDTICGKFFICRQANGELASITEADIARIKRWEQDGTLTMYRAHS